MPLCEKGAIVADTWTTVDETSPLPAEGGVILPLSRWLAEREALRGRNAPVGVRLPGGTPRGDVLEGGLEGLALVVVDFPKFRDGRGFTVARDLRERLGFTGTIRAVGHTLPDQYLALVRCGVDQVEIPDGADVAVWKRALELITGAYQTSVGADVALSPLKRALTGVV